MTFGKRFLAFGGLALFALTACDSQPQSLDSRNEDEDHYHEKSFSWNETARSGSLAKTAALQTRFNTVEELGQAAHALYDELKVSGASDSLWKPIDYACDALALALWNKYGTIRVRDSLVLDEASLKAGCRYIGEDGARAAEANALGKTAWAPNEGIDRQYPYKMIGTSWDDFNAVVYKSTGGETQFKKERKKFGITGWYDTDATRIGVRIYLIDCPTDGPRNCWIRTSPSNSNSNDDYASERDFAVGVNADLHVSDAVISMHSVDHAGRQFRATSSSGLSSVTQILNPATYSYVTW